MRTSDRVPSPSADGKNWRERPLWGCRHIQTSRRVALVATFLPHSLYVVSNYLYPTVSHQIIAVVRHHPVFLRPFWSFEKIGHLNFSNTVNVNMTYLLSIAHIRLASRFFHGLLNGGHQLRPSRQP
jgi:hypothetical protein